MALLVAEGAAVAAPSAPTRLRRLFPWLVFTLTFALLLSDSDREMLRQIEEAVAKIKDGRYGNCNECKSEISDKRLEAVPWARYCIKCQELEEKGLL